MRIKERPPIIRRAVVNDDFATLSFYGQKGGEATARRRASEAAANAYFAEQAELEHAARALQANEHLVPIEGSV